MKYDVHHNAVYLLQSSDAALVALCETWYFISIMKQIVIGVKHIIGFL